jgi:hypothetical protein
MDLINTDGRLDKHELNAFLSENKVRWVRYAWRALVCGVAVVWCWCDCGVVLVGVRVVWLWCGCGVVVVWLCGV